MSFEFQSTLVNVTPSYRIGGSQIGGVRIEENGGIRVARIIVTNDADVKFALSGPYESGDPDAIYAALATDLYEVATGVLLNEGAISSVEYDAEKITIDLEGSDRKFTFLSDAVVTEVTEVADHTWKLPTATFTALGTAAGTWRSSMDGTLEGLSTAITTEVADRIAAITAEEQRVDALIASGMWLFATQGDFPAAADNHGRVVHSHADGAIFYAHGGTWHQVAREIDLQSTISSLAAESLARETADTTLQANIDAEAAARASADTTEANTRSGADAALSARLDTLEADPTTATAVAAGDAATLSSANTYTDGEIATEASARTASDASLSGRLDVLEADPTTQALLDAETTARTTADSALDGRVSTLEGNAAITDPTTATAVAAVQSDVDANQTSSESADSALSGRLDVLEADPTTATAVAAVQADVDANEADADAALALKAPLADPDFTGQLDVDTNARIEFADNLTKIHNVLRGTSINIGNNIEVKPAAAGGRVEITGDLLIDASDFTDAANDTAAAAAGVVVGQVYRNGSQLMVRVS
jgi:hypothetical protein